MYSVTLWQHSSWECKKSFHCVFAAEGVRWRIKMEFMIRRFLFCYGLATTQWTSLAAQFWKMKIFPTKKGKMTDIFSAPTAGPVRVQLVSAWRLRAGQILRQQGKNKRGAIFQFISLVNPIREDGIPSWSQLYWLLGRPLIKDYYSSQGRVSLTWRARCQLCSVQFL